MLDVLDALLREEARPPIAWTGLMFARATVACTLSVLATCWLDGLRQIQEGTSASGVRGQYRAEVAAFAQAWRALACTENPAAVMAVTLDSYVEDMARTDTDAAPLIRMMLATGLVEPLERAFWAALIDAEMHGPLLALAAALAPPERGEADDTSGFGSDAVKVVIHALAHRGASREALQIHLDAWINATGAASGVRSIELASLN